MSTFKLTLEFVPCKSNNLWQARQCRCFNHHQSEDAGFGMCWAGSKCM